MSLSTNVSNLATRIATEVKAIRTLVNGNVADLSSLDTTAKSNLVLAINELKAALDTAASDISALETADTNLATDISNVDSKIGILSFLSTIDKTNLVAAINELKTELDNIDVSGQVAALIDDTQTLTNKTWSSSKINSEITESPTINNPTLEIQLGSPSVNLSATDFTAGNRTSYSAPYGFQLVYSSLNAANAAKAALDAAGKQFYFTNSTLDGSSGGQSIDGIGLVGTSTSVTSFGMAFNLDISGITAIDSADNTAVDEYWASGGFSPVNISVYTVGVTGASATITPLEIANLDGVTSNIQTQLNSKASTSYVDSAIAALVDGAPALLDTLNELAAAINDDASFASTITTALSTKADDSAVVHLTGAETIAGVKTFSDAPVVPDSSFAIAKVDGLQAALDSKASAANVGDTTVNYVTTFEAGLV